jgi:Domain of unknown function (DUF4926)
MSRLPYAARAILDLRKLQDYCLSPDHPRGRHKARVFRDALGIGQHDAAWLRAALLAKTAVLGALMAEENATMDSRLKILDPVALLADAPSNGLPRGQVGTIVDLLDAETALVEFSNDDGEAYAIIPCARSSLLVLHYVPEAA